MDRVEIISMAYHLGTTISECEEYQNFQESQSKVMRDADAVALLQEFQEARDQAVKKMEAGQEIPDEEQKYLHDLEEKMYNNPLIKGLFDAHEKFNNLMNGVYFALDQAISGNPGCGGGCGDCGSSCF
ncbi:MAG: YlbF family regulator [Syntrophomonadaceae bacterium]|jgi:cell fate (sporulation/competence/biofilm development) regulator YlbF (YheA/YmcA/DUF963 family)|nr:YlbF family regulator [Syntrophomonadaceae bacterium]